MTDGPRMILPSMPPCPTCGQPVEQLRGFGENTWAEPCGHPVLAIIGAGGVTGSTILRPRPDTPPTQPGS